MKFDIDDTKQEKSVEEITIPDDMKMMYDDIKLEEAFRTQEESFPSCAKRARFDDVNLPSGPNPLNPGYINPIGYSCNQKPTYKYFLNRFDNRLLINL